MSVSVNWLPYTRQVHKPKARLFCFAHSGGVASIFRNWQSYFPDDIEVYPVQLPGRENRFNEPFITSLANLSEELKHVVEPFLETPLILFGHSLGAVIAYELAKKLQGSCKKMQLFVSSCSAPHCLLHESPLHQLSDNEFIQSLKSYGGMPKQLLENEEALKILLPRLKADFTLFETYKCTASLLDIPLVALGGKKDDLVSEKNLNAWESYTNSSFNIHFFSGGHFYYQIETEAVCQMILKFNAQMKS